jgi:hypothetical protein
MSSTSIRAKIKSGLAKAVQATGSSASEIVYLVQREQSEFNSPLSPESPSDTLVELTNAIIKSYTSNEVDNESVRAGDKQLVSDSDQAITEGDTIRQGSTDFTVVSVETKAPTSDVLLYISQIREK